MNWNLFGIQMISIYRIVFDDAVFQSYMSSPLLPEQQFLWICKPWFIIEVKY